MAPLLKQRRLGRRQTYWFGLWLALTVSGVILHGLTWIPPDRLDAGLSATAEHSFVKPAANVLDAFAGPIWVAMSSLTGSWGVFSLFQSVIAHGIMAAGVLLACRTVLGLRRRLVVGRHKRSAIEASAPLDPTRRRFLVDVPISAAALLGTGVLADGALLEAFDLRIRKHTIPIADLPDQLVGFRAVLLSDTHLGPRIPAAFIRKAVSMSLDLRPDAFLLAGDYVHAGLRYIRPATELFRPLVESGIPTVGVLGNHDWYTGRGLISSYLSELGVRMVDNAHVLLDAHTRTFVDGPIASQEALCIAGVGDFLTDEVDIHRALQGVPGHTPRIVLCHNPDGADLDSMQHERIDLMLCGHTHGGQIALPLVGPIYVPCQTGTKYLGGLIKGPGFPVLVSRGVGMSVCPVRIGVPPEIVEITLTRL